MNNILQIENFRLSFHGSLGRVEAVRGVELSVAPGETLALAGESGCGKTALCRAVLMLHARHAKVDSGRILLCGQDVTAMTEKQLEAVRGRDAAMIFQDPMSSLNPVFPIGRQIMEPILRHQKVSRAEAKAQAIDLLWQVGIPDAEIRFSQYPHHFSGGMRQRAAIAIALACEPKLLIADEPTTSLDVKTQAQILELLQQICRERACGVLFVTHDLGIAREISDRIAVMKDGVIVESGKTADIFANPRHPYTKELLRYARYGKSGSHFHGAYKAEPEGEGEPDAGKSAEAEFDFGNPAGKKPAERNPAGEKPDTANPAERKSTGEKPAERKLTGEKPDTVNPADEREPAVTVSNLTKTFPLGKRKALKALEDFSLTVGKGEIVGIVGPSGCGKSTLAKCLADIYKPDGGTIVFAKGCRRQMIFQDSASALNPRMTLEEIIAEPLILAGRRKGQKLSRKEVREKVFAVMEQTELVNQLAERHPYDVSGGQRQRAAIARALITEPDFIIADEPISSLDVSTQAQIIHLLRRIRDQRELTMVLIAHDLPMAAHISDRIVEMKKSL